VLPFKASWEWREAIHDLHHRTFSSVAPFFFFARSPGFKRIRMAAASRRRRRGAFDGVRSPLRAIRVIRQLDMIMQTGTDFCMSRF